MSNTAHLKITWLDINERLNAVYDEIEILVDLIEDKIKSMPDAPRFESSKQNYSNLVIKLENLNDKAKGFCEHIDLHSKFDKIAEKSMSQLKREDVHFLLKMTHILLDLIQKSQFCCVCGKEFIGNEPIIDGMCHDCYF